MQYWACLLTFDLDLVTSQVFGSRPKRIQPNRGSLRLPHVTTASIHRCIYTGRYTPYPTIPSLRWHGLVHILKGEASCSVHYRTSWSNSEEQIHPRTSYARHLETVKPIYLLTHPLQVNMYICCIPKKRRIMISWIPLWQKDKKKGNLYFDDFLTFVFKIHTGNVCLYVWRK